MQTRKGKVEGEIGRNKRIKIGFEEKSEKDR
jgi:hypothetical protein